MALSSKELMDWLDMRTEKTTLPEGVMDDLKLAAADMGMSDDGRKLFFSLIEDYERLSNELEDQISFTKELADVDPLLKIGNRRAIANVIDREWEGGKRYHSPASIIIFSLDQELALEDYQGVMMKMAALIKTRTRMTDTFGRLDDEKFVIVVPTTNNIQAAWLSEKLREAINSKLEVNGEPLTCTFGVADMEASMNAEDWLRIAEAAHDRAKSDGGNRVIDYESHPDY